GHGRHDLRVGLDTRQDGGIAVTLGDRIDAALCFLVRIAIVLLECFQKGRVLTTDTFPILVAQIAPLLTQRALKLLPVGFDSVPIHPGSPFPPILRPCRYTARTDPNRSSRHALRTCALS